MKGAVAQSASREQRFPATATSVSASRALVRQLLEEVDRGELVDAAALVLSEVVTNALLHAGTPVDVALSWDGDGLLAHVGDGNSHVPTRRSYGATSGTGRGLRLLEQFVDEWGVTMRPEGKTVWFRLTSASLAESSPAGAHLGEAHSAARTSPEDTGHVVVTLCNLPLLIHAAWQEYAETLLREYLLLSMDEDHGEDAFMVHASATAAIAVLEEQIPHADVAIDPDRLMADATEPRVSAAEVTLAVPHEALADFRTLDSTIEEAVQLARAGRLMTPPSQPEIQEFRRWVCGQVSVQARGGAALPWSMEDVPTEVPSLDLHWDTTGVTNAVTAVVAADESNRIVAVSGTALRLLGYDEPAQLVGRRLVSIIPPRLHQSHVAGFMRYLLTGRKPLIGVTVTVPALRADGSEIDIDLTVGVDSTGDGRTVFVAEMRPA